MQIEDFKPTIPTDGQIHAIRQLTTVYTHLAQEILDGVEPSAHRTDALRKLLESKMTLIHGLTHPKE